MKIFVPHNSFRLPCRLISAAVAVVFSLTGILPPPNVRAQGVDALLNLPAPGTMVKLSAGYAPAVIKGIKIYADNPLRFDFIIDTGDSKLNDDALKDESAKLIKYFLAALTVPEEDLWVNLSPYEKDRIIPEQFGVTEMGRDLLAQDYILKQISASLMYPEDELGKTFWEKVYAKAQQLYGTTKIPINTFNKVWIVPQKAVVYQSGDVAFVTESHLKVMLEEDYLSLKENQGNAKFGADKISNDDAGKINNVSSSVVRDVVLPAIEKEVNEGQNFAPLRQIYHSMILAAWFKRNLKENVLSKIYVGKNKVGGVGIEDKAAKEKIYQQYLEAFKAGVYNYIRQEYDPEKQKNIKRKYFAGGAKMGDVGKVLAVERVSSPSLIETIEGIHSRLKAAHVTLELATGALVGYDEERLQAHQEAIDAENKKLRAMARYGFQRDKLRQEQSRNWVARIFNKKTREQLLADVKRLRGEVGAERAQLRLVKQAERDMVQKYDDYIPTLNRVIAEVSQTYDDLQAEVAGNEELATEINRQLIENHLGKKIEKLKAMPGDRRRMSNGEVNRFFTLALEQLLKGGFGYMWARRDEIENFEAELEKARMRNQELEEIAKRDEDFLSFYDRFLDGRTVEKAYSRIVDLLIRTEKVKWARAMERILMRENLPEPLLTQSKMALEKFLRPQPEGRSRDGIEDAPAEIANIPEKLLRDHFLDQPVLLRWDFVKENETMVEIFGKEAFDYLERVLVDVSLARLLTTEEHTDEAVMLGYRLFWLAEKRRDLRVELAPFLVMNAFRESGYSGERPFIPHGVDISNSPLYKFIMLLTPHDMEQLRDFPGVVDVINLIKKNPKAQQYFVDSPLWVKYTEAFKRKYSSVRDEGGTYYSARSAANVYLENPNTLLFDAEGGRSLTVREIVEDLAREIGVAPQEITDGERSVVNPVIKKIDQGLAIMSLALMREDNEDKQFFVMALLATLDVDIGEEGHELLGNILAYSRSARLKNELIDMIEQKTRSALSRDLKRKFALVPLQLFSKTSTDIQEKIRRMAPRLLDVFGGAETITDEHLQILATIFGKPKDSVRKTIRFISDITYSQRPMGSYNPEKIDKYFEVAQIDDNIIDTIRFLSGYGYKFDPDHVGALKVIFEQQESFRHVIESGYKDFYLNRSFLMYLTQHPDRYDELISLPQKAPRLFDFIKTGEGMYSDRDLIMDSLFNHDDAIGFITMVSEKLLKKEFVSRYLMARDPVNIFSWIDTLVIFDLTEPAAIVFIERLMNDLKGFDVGRVREAVAAIMARERNMDVDIFIAYVKDFGLNEALALFRIYTALMKKDFSNDMLVHSGIKMKTDNPREGIKQLQTIVKRFRQQLNVSGEISDEILNNPLELDLLRVAVNYDGSKWKRNVDFKELVVGYIRAKQAQRSGNLPEIFYSSEGQGSRTLRIGKIKASRLGIENFDFQDNAKAFFGKIVEELQSSLKLLGIPEDGRVTRARERITSVIVSEMNEGTQGLGRLRDNPKAAQQKERELANLEKLSQGVEQARDLPDLIAAMGEFDPKNNSPLDSELRRLLFLQGFLASATFVEEFKDRFRVAQDISLPNLNLFLEFTGNIIKEHVLGTNPDLADARLDITSDMRRTLRKHLNFKVFQDEMRRLLEKERKDTITLTVVPTRGILGELSGYFCDACWTRQNNIMENNQDMVFLTFIENYEDPLNARIVGGTLLIMTKSGNRDNFVVRGFNPQDRIADLYDMGELFDSFINDYLSALPGRETREHSIPSPNSGAFSNRPSVIAVGRARIGEENLPLDSINRFNGYDITNQVYVIRAPEDGKEELNEEEDAVPVASPAQGDDVVGGIDLNPEQMDLETQGELINYAISPEDIKQLERMPINGFTPVIFNIAPITNLPLFLGVAEPEKRPQVSMK